MKLYVETMDVVVTEVGDDGQVRLEAEGWIQPTLQERRAIIFAAQNEIALLTDLVEAMERPASAP
jgi:hypothetical protein